MKKGCFITIEGVEGVGKSTNIELVERLLSAQNISTVTTREPGGTELSEKIRSLLLDKNDVSMTDRAELLLVFAARSQHVEELIEPALARGDWVVSDRFTDSSFAYQGYGRGIDLELIENVEKISIDCFAPDLTFLLDLPVEIGLERAGKRGELDRFEQEDLNFFSRVRQGFVARANKFDRFRIINAEVSLEDVQRQITSILDPWITSWKEQG